MRAYRSGRRRNAPRRARLFHKQNNFSLQAGRYRPRSHSRPARDQAYGRPNPAPDALTFRRWLCAASPICRTPADPGRIQNTQMPPSGGQWQCIWGPVQDSDESNLALVAGYYPEPRMPRLHLRRDARHRCRHQRYLRHARANLEDLDVADPQPMPWALKDPARIASGTLDGFDVIKGLTDQRSHPIGKRSANS